MIVGIDLGTTNSLISVWKDGRSQLIPNALGHFLTPSCVSLGDEGQIVVGLPARDRMLSRPERSTAAFKRYMGTERKIQLAERSFRPEELSALVLKSLKADAEAFLGEPVTEAVITVPAYFNDTQRKATRLAGELAGLKVERLLNEPTAAALAYGLHQADPQSQFLIFDLGGGTFDVSILELFDGVMEVRATAGDNFLGGEDFSSVLIDGFLAERGKAAQLYRRTLTADQLAHLRAEAERVKRALSSMGAGEGDAAVNFIFRQGQEELVWPVTTQAYETLCAPLLERLRVPIERALRDAKLSASALDRIVLVGGASRMPLIHRLVARMFGRFPSRDIHPDEAIAMGAAVQAGLKARDAALNEIVMTDVCPYSLGIEVSEEISATQRRMGVFSPIIERNTVIPASRAKPFAPVHEGQKQLELKVFQGESRDVRDNVLLGQLMVPLPQMPGRQSLVDVRFTYDINGLLEVEATTRADGAKQVLVIEQRPGEMSKAQIQQSLLALGQLKIHPREHTENLALIERLKRLYEQHLGDRRAWIGHQMSEFEGVLERQDPREIAHIRVRLSEVLDQFEGTPVL